ncbi:pentapeptide repeat-containing protein, partial [Campylobacter volucris]|uniref:pentapeptide repeat-containing protein n=1 Tax=Campylobacter volucris TaxID=1031542 RepID=UPI001E483BC7
MNSEFGNKDNNEIDKDYENLKLRFTLIYFSESVFFDDSIFYECAEFIDSEFEKIVSFSNVTFYKIPNFYQIIFKGKLNAVNTNLNFTFDDLKIQIKEEYKKNIKEQYESSLNKIANFFRNFFRIFKSALIKDNNTLDASNFHKYELYCKEIELEEKKPKMFSKEWIDKWQLFFYRNICDHHTDILQSLNSLIIIIGIFGMLSFLMISGVNHYLGYKININHLYFSLEFYNKHIK